MSSYENRKKFHPIIKTEKNVIKFYLNLMKVIFKIPLKLYINSIGNLV